MLFHRNTVSVTVNGKKLSTPGAASGGRKRDWDRIIGKTMIYAAILVFIAMIVKFGVMA